MSAADQTDEQMLDEVQRETFNYFIREVNPVNGMVADSNQPGQPASIAAIGLALTAYPIGVERGFITRAEAVRRILATLEFFHHSTQSNAPDATGYKGFYYHFLDMDSGSRAWQSELSTIDSALLFAGMLAAAQYFDADNDDEKKLRERAEALYRRADWQWAQNGKLTVSHGWKPKSGFLRWQWEGYCEALILYVLGLGSPTYPLPKEAYRAWLSSYAWKSAYGLEMVYGGPLFMHQLSHIWIDFRGIRDLFMRDKNLDYFENSRRATLLQQRYAIENPLRYPYYGAQGWGITACNGPGPKMLKIDGIERRFFGYKARGVPFGPDDGTLAPWAVVASLPFAPEIVLPTMRFFIDEMELKERNGEGFKATFNPLFPNPENKKAGWSSPWKYGINQGPIVMMIENYRSGLVWELMRGCRYLLEGLRRAEFHGGWLEGLL
ncbi:MAG: glucoamylase family protein [Methylobacter sp.]|nr:glucoamylase family protein [Methylobacter sp.]